MQSLSDCLDIRISEGAVSEDSLAINRVVEDGLENIKQAEKAKVHTKGMTYPFQTHDFTNYGWI